METDILTLIGRDENAHLWRRISHSVPVQYAEIEALCKGNAVNITKQDLRALLDRQGIVYVMPDAPSNAKKGIRRVKRRKKKRS